MNICLGNSSFVRFTVCDLSGRLPSHESISFHVGSDGGLYDLNKLVPDHFVSFYFLNSVSKVYMRKKYL